MQVEISKNLSNITKIIKTWSRNNSDPEENTQLRSAPSSELRPPAVVPRRELPAEVHEGDLLRVMVTNRPGENHQKLLVAVVLVPALWLVYTAGKYV